MKKNAGLIAALLGVVLNFSLCLTKVFIGISSNSLAIYCDAINNLGDCFACVIALLGFALVKKQTERQRIRTQSLFTNYISVFIAVTGIYFVYNGIERMMYPLPVSYAVRYAVTLAVTIVIKFLMGIMFRAFNKKEGSPVLSALSLDSFLDCFVTLAALMSLVLVEKVNYAVDGLFAIITGSIITVSAIKNIIKESKALIID
jgi:cation diffusion facilitator family transporter